MTAYDSTTNKIATASDLAGLAGGMRFKGTIGTGGTAGADLPTTGVEIGDTYRISTKGTYDGQASNIGDLFIATSTTPDWAYIPSGNDEAVTQITAGTGLTGGTITSTGTIALDTSGVTAGTYQGLTIDAYGRVTGAVDEGYTTNTGTVTSVAITNAVDGGLTISGSPITTNGTITIGHTNSVAAQTTQAVYPITIDDNGHISGYGSAAVLLAKYVGTITGDDSTTDFSITHNLGSRDVTIQVYDTTSYEDVIVDTERTSINSITVSFASAPVTGKEYKVVIIG